MVYVPSIALWMHDGKSKIYYIVWSWRHHSPIFLGYSLSLVDHLSFLGFSTYYSLIVCCLLRFYFFPTSAWCARRGHMHWCWLVKHGRRAHALYFQTALLFSRRGIKLQATWYACADEGRPNIGHYHASSRRRRSRRRVVVVVPCCKRLRYFLPRGCSAWCSI